VAYSDAGGQANVAAVKIWNWSSLVYAWHVVADLFLIANVGNTLFLIGLVIVVLFGLLLAGGG
jgi:hypothetical protein